MTIELGLLISIGGFALALLANTAATKEKIKQDGEANGKLMETLSTMKQKVDEIWADKKATEKQVGKLSESMAIVQRDVQTAFSKLDHLTEDVAEVQNDVASLKTTTVMLNARICQEEDK